MKVLLGILATVVFLASAVSVLVGAVLKYAVTEGEVGGVDVEATGTIVLLGGILGFLLSSVCWASYWSFGGASGSTRASPWRSVVRRLPRREGHGHRHLGCEGAVEVRR